MKERNTMEMPKYNCYKQVWALKIGDIRISDGGAIITPQESGYAPFAVDVDYMKKHQPQVGGYYVVYNDGYKSYSPSKAFEEGYEKA